MINAQEENALAIIKLDEKTKYIEVNINCADWYIRVVHNEEIQKVSLVTTNERNAGISIIGLLEGAKTPKLGNEFPKTMVFDNRPGKDPMFDVNAINMKLIIGSIDDQLLPSQRFGLQRIPISFVSHS